MTTPDPTYPSRPALLPATTATSRGAIPAHAGSSPTLRPRPVRSRSGFHAVKRVAATAGFLLMGGMVAGGVSPAPLLGQSLFSGGGLGVPASPLDARSRMLGGVGIGLSGAHYSATDPAAAGWLVVPGLMASMESDTESFDGGPTTGRTRFPGFGIAYPFGSTVYTLGFRGVLSQELRSQVDRQVDFGDGLLVDAIDRFESRGGIGSAQLGLARRLSSRLSVGGNVGWYLGTVDRLFERQLDPSEVGPEVEFFQAQGRWRAQGISATGSVSWQPISEVRLAAGATWSGTLELVPSASTTGETLEVPLPLTLRAGGQATLAPGLSLVASVSQADWSEAAAAMNDEAANGTVLQWGAGLEWDAASLRGRRMPLAVGYRSGDLPFSFSGRSARETALTGGLSLFLLENEGVPLVNLELSMERGNRETSAVSESFLRTSVTFRVSGL